MYHATIQAMECFKCGCLCVNWPNEDSEIVPEQSKGGDEGCGCGSKACAGNKVLCDAGGSLDYDTKPISGADIECDPTFGRVW